MTSLLAAGPTSRADLARGTGLSRTAVSSLISELITTGHVTETTDRGQPHKGGSGRPPLLVALSTPHGGVEDFAATMVRTALHAAGLTREDLQGVAMCVPAPLDRRHARISTGILPGWHDLSTGEELQRRLSAPVFVDNDANLGALAEVERGAARGVADVVYVKVASGVGAGLVLGGRLHRGATGIAGELGHVQVDDDGRLCRCGHRGCLETAVSAARLHADLQPAYDEPLDVGRVLELDSAGDATVGRVLGDAGRTIGRALADVCNTLNPQVVLLGGSLGTSPSLAHGIREAIDQHAQPDTAAAVRVAAGSLGDRAAIVGAVSLAIARVAQV